MKKVWVHLLTTFAVRAINLEWVADLIAGQFLNCMRRFVSRRGKPDLIISGKTPQFKLVNTTLNKQWQQVLSDMEVLNYVAVEEFKWIYNTALAPWQGSSCDRLDSTMFKKVSMRKLFSLEQLIIM